MNIKVNYNKNVGNETKIIRKKAKRCEGGYTIINYFVFPATKIRPFSYNKKVCRGEMFILAGEKLFSIIL
jgi:hypothetical protein